MLLTKNINSVKPLVQHGEQPTGRRQSALPYSRTNYGLHLNNEYSGRFSLPADSRAVSRYLERHHEWFEHCAYPMSVSPLGPNSYRLCPGRFKCLNFSVEPSLGLRLTPLADGSYQLQNMPLPSDEETSTHEIDFCLSLSLNEKCSADSSAEVLTVIEWQMDVSIEADLPRVVQPLPSAVVHRASQEVLNRVVNQVIRHLTARITTDFTERGLGYGDGETNLS